VELACVPYRHVHDDSGFQERKQKLIGCGALIIPDELEPVRPAE
jgi:hypothetical protein